jgi:hypothetical protein
MHPFSKDQRKKFQASDDVLLPGFWESFASLSLRSPRIMLAV